MLKIALVGTSLLAFFLLSGCTAELDDSQQLMKDPIKTIINKIQKVNFIGNVSINSFKVIFVKECSIELWTIEHNITDIANCKGWALLKEREIYIISGKGIDETYRTFCHEKCHIDTFLRFDENGNAVYRWVKMDVKMNKTEDEFYCYRENPWVTGKECSDLFQKLEEAIK